MGSKFIALNFKYKGLFFLFVLLLALFGASVGKKLSINLELDKLLPDHSESVVEMNKISDEIGGIGHLNILIGPISNPQQWIPNATEQLKALPDVKYVLDKTEEYLLEDKALYLMSLKDFLKLRKNARVLFNKGKVGFFNLGLEDESIREQNKKDARQYFKDFKKDNESEKYFLSKDKTYALIMIKPKFESVDLERSEKLTQDVNNLLKKILPGVPFKLLGRYVEKVRDTRQVERDIVKTGTISIILIITFLILGLGSPVGAVFVILGVFLSLGWTVACAYYFVGQINILTGFLIAILAGLGADYGIHLFKRLQEELADGLTQEQAIQTAYHKTGRALFSSSLSTATAFLCLIYSDFKGFSELGIIAGSGVLSVFLVFMLTFPFLATFLKKEKYHKVTRVWSFYPFKPKFLKFLLPLFIVVLFWAPKVQFQYDFNKMRDISKESSQLKVFVDKLYGKSTSPVALLAKNRDQADEISKYVSQEKFKDVISNSLSLSDIHPMDMKSRYRKIKKLKKLIKDVTPEEFKEKTGLELSKVKNWLNTKPYSMKALPEHLLSIFGKHGSVVLIYPTKQIDNKYDLDELAHLLRSLKEKFPGVQIGSDTLVFSEILNFIFHDGKKILLFFFAGLFVTFILDFRSIKSAVILELQIVLGVALLMAVMGLFGVKFTILNVGIFPAVLAVGIDMGVHIRHRELETGSALKGAILSANPIHISFITTLIGFGVLFLAEAKILTGIAYLATFGMFSMYFICMVLYPIAAEKMKIKRSHKGIVNGRIEES